MGAEVHRTPHASTCTELDAASPPCVYAAHDWLVRMGIDRGGISSGRVLDDAVLWNPPVATETNMDREIKALLMVVALLTAAGTGAQEATASFAALDQDKDGMISVTEARGDKKVSAQFATADKNQDGFLSRAEFDAIVAR